MYYGYGLYALTIRHINILKMVTNINSKSLEDEYIK